MTRYDFDEIVDRSNNDAMKVERPRKLTGRDDLIPLWVADMDFRTPPFVINAIRCKLDRGILGYPVVPADYQNSIVRWAKRQYDMEVLPGEIHYVPGVVPGLYFAINAFSSVGDGVLIQPPVYHPFRHAITGSGRVCLTNELKFSDGRLEVDFSDFEQKVSQSKIFILCHPHNPIGQAWSIPVLQRMAEICRRHGVLVLSDEIHADMMNGGARYTPFATVSDDARANSITLMAPSKVFNMPGVVDSHAIVFDNDLRERFFRYLDDNDVAFGNSFAYDCTIACYSDEGEEWRRQMLDYVGANFDLVQSFLADKCPKIIPVRPNASFLMWLDCRALGLSQSKLVSFFIDEAGLYLNDGSMFGAGGEGFMRINVASPRSIISTALDRLHQAYLKRAFR